MFQHTEPCNRPVTAALNRSPATQALLLTSTSPLTSIQVSDAPSAEFNSTHLWTVYFTVTPEVQAFELHLLSSAASFESWTPRISLTHQVRTFQENLF